MALAPPAAGLLLIANEVNELRDRGDLGLEVYPGAESLHRADAQPEAGRDLLGAHAVDQQSQDLTLPAGEAREWPRTARARRVLLAGGFVHRERGANVRQQCRRRCRLLEELDRPGLERAHRRGDGPVSGEHDDRQRRVPAAELVLEIQAVLAVQAQIEDETPGARWL